MDDGLSLLIIDVYSQKRNDDNELSFTVGADTASKFSIRRIML